MSELTLQMQKAIHEYERKNGNDPSKINISDNYLSALWAEHVKQLVDGYNEFKSNALLPKEVPVPNIPDKYKNGDCFMGIKMNVTESDHKTGFTLE